MVVAVKKVLQFHLLRKMRRNFMVKRWRVLLKNRFRPLLMILFEVIVYHLFLMKKVTLFTHTCIITHLGRLLEPFEILVTELINIIKTW